MRHLLDIIDFSAEEIEGLLDAAADMIKSPEKYYEALQHKKLATLFFEPSTRTRLSFEAAMLELGGSVIGFSSADSSSATKGETVADTVLTVGCYADIIAMRHPLEGAPLAAVMRSEVPIINAGDGGHHHPTQTLADLLTIKQEVGRLGDLVVGICGDLKYGRTVHSLISALSRYENIKFVLIAPEELQIPAYIKEDVLLPTGSVYQETTSLENAIPELDILYMTRIQRERFDDKAEYERLKDSYVLTMQKLQTAKPDMKVMHPLPRVNEIAVEVDFDPRAVYIKQMWYGKQIRKALLIKLLAQESLKTPADFSFQLTDHTCQNIKCITNAETTLGKKTKEVDGIRRCAYCEHEIKYKASRSRRIVTKES